MKSGLNDEQKYSTWQQMHADETEKFMQEQQKKTMAMMDDFRNNSKVNPNAYWDNQSTGQKVGNALSLVMSGFFGGMAGQKNMASDVISQGIKDNIDAQVHNIQTKRQAIDDQNNMVAQYMKNGLDLQEAKHASMATQQQMVKDRLGMNASQFAGDNAKNAAMLEGSKRDQETATALSNAQTATANRAKEYQDMKYQRLNENWTLQNRQGLISALQGGGPIDISNPEVAAHAVRLPNGNYTLAARPEDAAKGRDIVTAGTSYQNALKDVHSAASKYTDWLSAVNYPGTKSDVAKQAYLASVNRAKAAAHVYYKVKTAGKEGEGGETPASLLDELSGAGRIGGSKAVHDRDLAQLSKLIDDQTEDIADQLRSNNIRMPAKVNKEKRTPVGG
jgi:hypothetical protein